MMRNLAACAIPFLFLWAFPARGGDDAVKAAVDRIICPLIEKKTAVGIAAGVITKDGRRVFGYGRLANDRDQQPDGNTLFEIGSMTKVFTALVLADMARDGLVKPDDPVRRYLPDSVTVPMRGGREITLLDLVTHSSGLPRMPSNFELSESRSPGDPYAHYPPDLLYAFLSKHTLRRDIGSEYEYSNLGYAVLGHTLARKAGVSYEDLVVQRICTPLNMNDTRVTLSEQQRRRLAPGHDDTGKPAANWNFDVFAGAGALRSSAHDMLIFLSANMGLTKTNLRWAMDTCHQERRKAGNEHQSVGWGFHIYKPPDAAVKIVWHNGGTGGYHSYMGFIKKSQTGVIVLSNCSQSIDSAAIRILKALSPDWN